MTTMAQHHFGRATRERPLDFLYDPISHCSSQRFYLKSKVQAKSQACHLVYVPVFPYMFSCLPKFAAGYYQARDNLSYPSHVDYGYPKPKDAPVQNLLVRARGTDRWQSYQRPHLPNDHLGPARYFDIDKETRLDPHNVSRTDEQKDHLPAEVETRSVGCQTIYRTQSAQTLPTELGDKLRQAFQDFDTIYPQHAQPFTEKTRALIERGVQRQKMRQDIAKLSIASAEDPYKQTKHFQELEKDKWAFLGDEIQEAMNNRFRSFKACIQNSQDYLRYRTSEAQKALVKSEDERFNQEMATVWYDVNIWRRFHQWTKRMTGRKMSLWQTHPPDAQLLRQVPEVFDWEARRYVPFQRKGDIVAGLTWDNQPDFYMDTWEGYSQVFGNLQPGHLRADIYLPLRQSIYGPKGYIKRKYKEAARFDHISFTVDEKDYGVSTVDLNNHRKKQLPPALLRPVPPSKRRLDMLRVTPIDMDRLSAFRAAVIIQKVVRGRGIQKKIQKGTELKQNLIDEVLSNVALTAQAKTEMSRRYVEYRNQARVLLFYQYRCRFIDSFLSCIEAERGTKILQEKHLELSRHIELTKIDRLRRYAETQRRMREAQEAGRRQQEYRRRCETERTVQQFQAGHRFSARRTAESAIVRMERFVSAEAQSTMEKNARKQVMKARDSLQFALNQQERETFVAAMVYGAMIPETQRVLVREAQEAAAQSRRLAVHKAVFQAMSTLSRTSARRNVESGPGRDEEGQEASLVETSISLDNNVRPSHQLDRLSDVYQKNLKRKRHLRRRMDTQRNFSKRLLTKGQQRSLVWRSSKVKWEGSRSKFTSGYQRSSDGAKGHLRKVYLSTENWLARNADSLEPVRSNTNEDGRGQVLDEEEEEEVVVYEPQQLTANDVIKMRLVQAKLNG
ncbi:hypothetical protein RvY_03182 [Ramazzottius varieornatus]|uniref:Uncharacterized protein n=1 Tax=Ramazzottius varieornatus TaxID=947166 RepID=A0A1D1UM56_RAMVA|nr:hypothetical protein RvY_03182 [Ramazzottius varieornatus]